MIFLSATNFTATETANRYETPSHSFYWMGYLYRPGHSAGQASVKALAREYDEGACWEYVTGHCRGNFVLVIYDKSNEMYFIATDPSGMFQCYYSSEAFSTHFLELVGYHNLGPADLSTRACLDFIQMGYVYFDRTFFAEINKLRPGTALYWSRKEGIKLVSRTVDELSDSTGIDISQWQEHLGHAMKLEHINMDLTGGSDTRFILAALLASGIRPDTSTYGSDKDPDVSTAKRIAGMLQLRHRQHRPHGPQTSPRFYFHLVDGLADIGRYLGFYQVASAKSMAGYGLSLNGGGGGLCDDFLWQQDFPFYKRKKPDWHRLFNLRILQKGVPGTLLGEKLTPRLDEWHTWWMDNLALYGGPTNTASYDRVFYDILMRERVGHSNAMESRLIPSYSPILERAFACWCYSRSRLTGWLNLIQRNAVTACNTKLARLATNHGQLNLDSRKLHLLKEGGKKFNEYARKGMRYYFGANTAAKVTAHQNEYWLSFLSQNNEGSTAFRKLKKEGILASDLSPQDIPALYAGRLVTLGLLLEFLEYPFDSGRSAHK